MTRTREDMLAELRADPRVDVLVVGGGINGISTFRELVLQGVRTLLVDRGDFCGACSSAPSRMIHGGLRYLENGEISLVHESLTERDALLRNAPHFVRPLPTTVPIQYVFSGLLNGAFGFFRLRTRPAERGAVVVKAGLALYDFLSRHSRAMPRHVFRGREATRRAWPRLTRTVRFSATYHDAWISYPERLGIELIADGTASGPHAIAVNHLDAVGRDGASLVLEDRLGGGTIAVDAKLIVNATGAWVDETNTQLGRSAERFVGGTKGSHLVLYHPELMAALNGHMIYFENIDGRVCIVYPYLDRVLLGSTDIRVDKPGEIRCEDEEVDYMLKSLSSVFPTITVRPDQIVYRYSGVRPLPHSEASFTGRISRDHFIAEIEGSPPTLCLIGGKWTTFRAFGEQAADRALALLGRERRVSTSDRSIGGGRDYSDAVSDDLVDVLVAQFGVTAARARHALAHYGTSAGEVLASCGGDDDRPLGATEYTELELRHLIRSEHARTLGDLLQRRASLAITGALSSAILARAAAILADELGWSADHADKEEAQFRALLARNHALTADVLAARDHTA